MGGIRHESLVLDDEGNGFGRTGDEPEAVGVVCGRGEKLLLRVVGDDVWGSLTGIDVESGNAPGMVVVEHQPGALLVGVEEGYGTRAGIGHIGNILDAHPGGVGGVLVGGRGPLVRCSVTDPWRDSPVEVERGTVFSVAALRFRDFSAHGILWIEFHHSVHHRAHARAHDRGVGWNEQVACHSGREQVTEQYSHWSVLGGNDCRTQVVGGGYPGIVGDGSARAVQLCIGQRYLCSRDDGCRELDVTAKERTRQVGVHLLPVLDHSNFIVVRPRIGRGVWNRHRNVLAEVVDPTLRKSWQTVDKFPNAAGHNDAVTGFPGGAVGVVRARCRHRDGTCPRSYNGWQGAVGVVGMAEIAGRLGRCGHRRH